MKNKPIRKIAATAPQPSSVFLVDDHPIVRRALAQLIAHETDLTVAGEAGDVDSGLQGILRTQPHIVVMDLSLGADSGLRLLEELHLRQPDVRILVLSMFDEAMYAERCLRAGAAGYVMKSEPPEKVIGALRTIIADGIAVSEQQAARMLSHVVAGKKGVRTAHTLLTNRELEIFHLLGAGLSPRQISEQLHRSIKTVNTHLERIKIKLHVRNHRELLIHAHRSVNDLGRTDQPT
jgi:DNA-binding NarL/FixJ family response regulator